MGTVYKKVENIERNNTKYFGSSTEWWNNRYVDWGKIAATRESITAAIYWQNLCDFLAMNEGYVPHGYPDCEHYSIGYGLLFKRSDRSGYELLAIRAFKEALGIDLNSFIPMEIFNTDRAQTLAALKQYRLTPDQCMKLLSYTLEDNEYFIRARIKGFDLLSANEKITIHSLWYNSPSLVGKNLVGFLTNYIETSDLLDCLDCLYEIECNSNSAQGEHYLGLQNRRYRESTMFSNKALDFVVRVPEQYFDNFLDHLAKDMPKLYEKLSQFFDLSESVEESVKLAILTGQIDAAHLPGLAYIQRKMKILSKDK